MNTQVKNYIINVLTAENRNPNNAPFIDSDHGLAITFACNDNFENICYQTGDNSYMGPIYHRPYWAECYLFTGSDLLDLVTTVISQLEERFTE